MLDATSDPSSGGEELERLVTLGNRGCILRDSLGAGLICLVHFRDELIYVSRVLCMVQVCQRPIGSGADRVTP